MAADEQPVEIDRAEVGGDDDPDIAAGRRCPSCRHDLTSHNVEVWNAGYATARRHFREASE